jgi:hypothetical protein
MYKIINNYRFEYVELTLAFGKQNTIKEFFPQEKYKNLKQLDLNKYGKGAFCRFNIDLKWSSKSGVYIFLINEKLIYIGQCANFRKRFNTGYGNISPRNCFTGGQSTNCKMNRVVLNAVKRNEKVEVLFHDTLNYDAVERELIGLYKPYYNVMLNVDVPKKLALNIVKGSYNFDNESKLDKFIEKYKNKKGLIKTMKKFTTEEIREHIRSILRYERGKGNKEVVLKSGDIHRDLELSNMMPSVCNAMYSIMESKDVVLHKTPSGFRSTITIKYILLVNR